MEHPLELARAANPLEIAITVWVYDRPKQAVVNTNSRLTTISLETEVTCRRNNAEEIFGEYQVITHDICGLATGAPPALSKCTLRIDMYVRGRAFTTPVVVLPNQEAEMDLGLDIIAQDN